MSSINQIITNAVHQVYKKGMSEELLLTELLAVLCPAAPVPEPKKKKTKKISSLPECVHCTVAGDHLADECPCVAALMDAEEAEKQAADPADELAKVMEVMAIEKPKRKRLTDEEKASAKAAKDAEKAAAKAAAKAAKDAEKAAAKAEKAAAKSRKSRSPSPDKEKTEYELEVEAAAPVLAEKVAEMERGWTPEWQMNSSDAEELTDVVWKAETYKVDKIGAVFMEGEQVGQVGVGEFAELRV